MNNNEKTIIRIADILSRSLGYVRCPFYLYEEVAHLCKYAPDLTKLLNRPHVDKIQNTINCYFDIERRWNSPYTISLKDNILAANESVINQLTMIDYMQSGMTVALAIFALEETRYKKRENGIIVKVCPLNLIYEQNESIRSGKMTFQSSAEDSSDDSSDDSSKHLGTELKQKPKKANNHNTTPK